MLYLRKSAFVNGIWSMWNRELRKEDIMFKILVVEDDKALNFEDAWEEKDINIDTDIEDDVYVNSSRELLSIVWNNLMSNAIKFTEAGGIVKVSLKVENGKAIVAVSDTGCGISHEDGKQIFEKFYQGDTSHSVQGNGLGLALVKRIVDITGSDIAVESEIGKGSTFTVVLRSLVDR